jgi:hypothetical protein
MTQHLGTPPRPWAGLETHLYVVPDSPSARNTCTTASAWTNPNMENHDSGAGRRRKLAKLSLLLGFLARKHAGAFTDAG